VHTLIVLATFGAEFGGVPDALAILGGLLVVTIGFAVSAQSHQPRDPLAPL
jgi:hypothetical protein